MKTILSCLFLLLSLSAQIATSIERHGHRWTFQTPREVGTFINGDPFVVGPVTITDIFPASTTVNGRAMNGSAVNPPFNGKQGYDNGQSQWMEYNETLNVGDDLPLVLQPGASLVSTWSDEAPGGGAVIKSAAVLTVLSSRPAVTCFRPPYSGPNKPTLPYPAALLRPENLVRVTAPSFATDLPRMTAQFERLWLDTVPGWGGEYGHPSAAMPMYYRDFTTVAEGLLFALAADVPVSQKLGGAAALTQWGIDVYWNVRNGWFGDGGGHGTGRKMPIVFAGLMGIDECLTVNAACLTNPMHDHRGVFTDDGQTWFVSQADVGRNGYTQAMVGTPEWTNYHYTNPESDDPSWDGNAYRRCCHSNAWHGQFLVLRAMGGLRAWDWPAAFAYHDRYVQECFARGEADYIKAWGNIAYFDEYRRLRKADLRGFVTIGIPEVGKPTLLAATPPHQGQSWTVHIDAGEPRVVAGVLARSSRTALRPSRSWGPFQTQGLVFVNVSDYQVSVPFVTDVTGKAIVMIPPATDTAGATYTLQAVVLNDAGLTPTNAVEVAIQPPL